MIAQTKLATRKEVIPIDITKALGEEEPLGIILCAGKDEEDIEYLELDKSGIHVAQYLTGLPPKEILEAKLRQAINVARENYAKKETIKLLDKNGE